jgi:hypothetical protein
VRRGLRSFASGCTSAAAAAVVLRRLLIER